MCAMRIMGIYHWLSIILVVASAEIHLHVEDIDFVKCVSEVSNKFFMPGSTIIFSMYVTEFNETIMEKAMLDSHLITFKLPKGAKCANNKTEVTGHKLFDPGAKGIEEAGIDAFTFDYLFFNNFVFHELHKSGQWSLMVSPDILRRGYDSLFVSVKNYILAVDVEGSGGFFRFEMIKQFLPVAFYKTNPTASRYLVMLVGEGATIEHARTILKHLYKLAALDAVILIKNSTGAVNIYKLQKGICGSFKRVVKVDTWTIERGVGKFILNSSLNLTDDPSIEGCNITYMVKDKAPRGIRNQKWDVLGEEITKLIAEFLKIDYIYTKGEKNNVRVRLYLKAAVNTLSAVAYKRLKFFVTLAEPYPRWASMTRVFKPEAWLSIFLSLVLAAIVWRCLSTQDTSSFILCFLNTWAAFLGAAVDQIPSRDAVRVFFFSWVVYSLSIGTVFLTFVTCYLVNPGLQYQISTFQELIDLNFTLALDEHLATRIMDNYREFRDTSYYFSVGTDVVAVLQNMPNIAVFASEEQLESYVEEVCGSYKELNFRITDYHMDVPLVMYSYPKAHIIKDLKLEPIVRLVEAGIPGKLLGDIADPTGKKRARVGVHLEEEYEQISMVHLQSPFMLLALGLVVSFVLFVLELFIYKIKKPKYKTVNNN